MSVTITDVARKAGVSIATVSRTLNKHAHIHNKTRTKVFNAIEILGYNSKVIEKKATIMAQQKAQELNIGILLCPIVEQSDLLSLKYFNEILSGIQSFFTQYGNVNLQLATWELDEGKQHNALLKRMKQFDGVLITGNPTNRLLKLLAYHRINLVMASNDNDNLQFNTIASDNITGGMQAARYLLDRGHVKIGFLDASYGRISSWEKRKIGALIETVTRVGIENFICHTSSSTDIKEIAESLRKWFDLHGMPDALILPTSHAILAVEQVLSERNLKCPEDLSIFSFDDFGTTFQIQTTHLQTFPQQIGIKAAQRIIQIIKFPHSEEKAHKVIVPMQLVEGNSVLVKNKSE